MIRHQFNKRSPQARLQGEEILYELFWNYLYAKHKNHKMKVLKLKAYLRRMKGRLTP
jgi:hypothetical protein